MRKAKALFEYEPVEDDELALKVGDIITEVKDADVGWCEGSLNGKRGMFPDNFVEMLKEEEEKKVPAPPAAHKKPSKKTTTNTSNPSQVSKLHQASDVIRRLKVNFSYTAENEDEISLEIGDIVDIVKDVEEGWAEGINRGKKGVFPTNFGEVIESSSDDAEETNDAAAGTKEEAENKQNEELAAAPPKKVKGIGFGNIFGDGPIKLRQRSIGETDRKKNLSTAPAKPVLTPAKEKEPAKDVTPAKTKKTLHYCKVMFDYARDNDDELELKKGEIVVILSKNPGDDGWWEGEKDENGKRRKGVFPDNFVIEMTPDEVKDYERQLQAKGDPEAAKETKIMKPQNKEVKKVTPLLPTLPSQAVKPVVNNDFAMNDSTETHFIEPTTTEHTLAHMKRPAGPKNRRKPGAAERREKASVATETQQVANGAEGMSEEEDAKPEKVPEPAPKKESVKRGVAVLPGLGGGVGEGATGETPSWLQNLKNRQSVKKPPPPPPTQTKEPTSSEPPAWLGRLKKRQSSEFPEKPAPPTPKEKAALQPKPAPEKPKPAPEKAKPVVEKPANGQAALIPPAKPAALKPAQKPSSPSPTEKPLAAWQVERQQKSRKMKTEAPEEKAPEPPSEQPSAAAETPPQPAWKNSLTRKSPAAVKSPTETHPPTAVVKKPDKPPIGTPVTTPVGAPRAKPPTPKGKPAPAAKPASSTAVEELKNEMKHMKDEMEKTRNEMKKEILRLNSELQNERNHRISLEEEVRKLRLQVSS